MQELTNTGLAARRGNIIRVAVVDDHAAIRSGLEAAIASEPGLACVGLVADAEQLAPLMYRARPGVVVLDYHLPRINGLLLCRQIKSRRARARRHRVLRVRRRGPCDPRDRGRRRRARGQERARPRAPHGDPLRQPGRIVAAACDAGAASRGPRHARRHDIPILELLVQRTPHARIASQLAIERADARASHRPDARSVVRSGCPTCQPPSPPQSASAPSARPVGDSSVRMGARPHGNGTDRRRSSSRAVQQGDLRCTERELTAADLDSASLSALLDDADPHRRVVDLRGRRSRGARHGDRHPQPVVATRALRGRRGPARASRCAERHPRAP